MRELLSQSRRSVLMQEHDPATNQTIVWKVCSPAKGSVHELQNEFTICESAALPGIRNPLRQGIYQNKGAFAYVYFDGLPLSQYLTEVVTLSVQDSLSIAIEIVRILKQLHQKQIFHLRLNTSHVLYQPQTKKMQIIDFSLASQNPVDRAVDFQDWGDELAFIAPEQMGRWGQVSDHRTDLYSFGVILYRLLTGKLPFYDTDISKLVHYHLVRLPTLPHHLNDQIPVSLSSIVLKLLEKNASERYQTAHGILQDLLECQDALTRGSEFRLNTLGKFDGTESIKLSDQLYGSQQTLRQIEVELGKHKKGKGKLFILSGEPGTGKTAIVQSLRKQFQCRNEILVTIPCVHSAAGMTHIPFLTGLRELAFWLLTLPEDQLSQWRPLLKAAIGQDESLLSASIPEFAWILESDGTAVPVSNQGANHAALPALFESLIGGLVNSNIPVVLVLEDAHQAEKAVQDSLHRLFKSTIHTGLNLVVTTRPSAGNPALSEHLNELRTWLPDNVSIELNNLSRTDVLTLLTDSIDIDELETFGSIVHKKTAGNPCLFRRFIHECYQEKSIWFDSASRRWAWDREKIRERAPADNVVDLLLKNLDHPSSPPPHEVLSAAACFETGFTIEALSQLFIMGQATLGSILSKGIDDQLLIRSATGYRFSHEKLRARIYDLIPKKERSRYHFKIAQSLASPDGANHAITPVYEAATHYTLGCGMVPAGERFFIVELNLKAGLAAREASDFGQAYHFFVNGIGLVRQEDWDLHYDTVLQLFNQATETGLINGLHQEADRWLEQALQRAKTIDDRIKSHEIKLNQLSENHQFGEAVTHLLTVLEEIGYGMPRYPGKLYMLRELLAVTWLIRNKSVTSIPLMPTMTQERALAFLKVVANSATSIHGFAPELAPIMYFRCIRLCLQYGLSVYAPFAYMSYATIQLFFGRAKRGYEYGRMALRMTDQLSAEIVRAKVMVVFYGFISFWRERLRDSIEPLGKAYEIARKNGDLQYAAFALNFRSTVRWHAGDNLAELLASIEEDIRLIKEMEQPLVLTISEVLYHFVLRLVQGSDAPLSLQEDDMDESALLARLDAIGDNATKFDVYVNKVILFCLLNHYDEAQAASDIASKYEEDNTNQQNIYPSFLLFSTIACIVNAKNPVSGRSQKLNKQIRRNIRQMKTFAREVPENYANKLALLRALESENPATPAPTTAYYEEAISLSQQNNFTHEEAVAREYFARYLYQAGRSDYADWMMQKAFQDYEKWGSKAKCRQLEKEFPNLFGEQIRPENKISFDSFQDHFDLTSIIQANQMLSSENTRDGLLKRMVEIVIQNASATRVLILLRNAEQQFLPGVTGSNQGTQLLKSTQKVPAYPENIVQWVIHTKSVFRSDKLATDQQEIFKKNLSVCCLPISSQNSLLGVLYLENDLSEAAFNDKRVEFFITISAQLAISLDNVLLYEGMEEKVKQRTLALEHSLGNLKATQEQLIQKEKLASLGELIAGIAHEIQNPLNFVNNFSEVSAELTQELDQEMLNGNIEEAKIIIGDLHDNLEKIHHHGRRAENIVKGMLEHARVRPGEMVPSDINALVDEYLRLSYQSLRARIKDFNCELVIDLNTSVGLVPISVSDMGRVLLNLFNNAFYATYQRQSMTGAKFHPCVWVSSSIKDGKAEVRIRDNGSGIPEDIQAKIFQPFFTTKPSGEGTGLGLSLSYDIITKGHRGELSFSSQLNVGTEFVIQIPVD